jgi:hypothetical protein
MTRDGRRRIGRWSVTTVVAALAGLTGCGGGMDLGSSVRVPAEQRQIVEASSAGKEITLPKDQPFNIHLKQSTQTPGANGSAQGTADANGWGDASCSAVVADGGAATGEFHIGQAIDYRGDAPMKTAVKLSFKLNHELNAEPIAVGTVAQLALTISVRDSSGRVSPKMAVEALSSDDAPGKAGRSDTRDFSFVMEPGRSYQILLDGNVSAASDAHAKATAKMAVSGLQMEMAFSPSPVPTTTTAPAAK